MNQTTVTNRRYQKELGFALLLYMALLVGALLLSADMQSQMEQWLKPALTALKNADSPDEALAILASANPQVQDDVLVQAIAQAMFVAELVGGDGVLQELGE